MVVTLGILRCAQNDGSDLKQDTCKGNGNSVVVGVTVFIPPIA
ncbi:MAG TPA: hypothetical protein VGG81_07160 [Edaphobacter sp.]|jgi:hypothetical protein